MALALTKFIAHGTEAEEPVNKRYIQRAIFEFTAAATDVDIDVGDGTGTFWTAVGGSEPGTSALKALKDINTRATACLGVRSPQLMDRVQSAAAGNNGEYAITADTYGPSIAVKANDGETAWKLVVEWYLKDGAEPVTLVATSSAQVAA